MPKNGLQPDIRIFCMFPPDSTYHGKAAVFGLQDKTGNLTMGRPLPDGTLAFDVIVIISDDNPPKFTGKYVHGTPHDRFIYLSYRLVDTPDNWIKRIKVPLSITAAQAKAVKDDIATTLATYVDGRLAARVEIAWKVIRR